MTIRASMTAYSTAVGPSSLFRNFTTDANIISVLFRMTAPVSLTHRNPQDSAFAGEHLSQTTVRIPMESSSHVSG
jgi:hypothetical protein